MERFKETALIFFIFLVILLAGVAAGFALLSLGVIKALVETGIGY